MRARGACGGLGLLFAVTLGCATPQAPSQTEPAAAATIVPDGRATTDAAQKNSDLDVALALYDDARYAEAANAFAAAYETGDGSAAALAGQAQSLQMAGDCVGAAVVYERFLDVAVDPTYTNAVHTMVDDCKAR